MKLKKALSLTLALVMSLTLAIPAFAVEGDDPAYSLVDTTPGTITVNFDKNGGYHTVISKTVTAGGVYGDLPTPTREGYTFDGWYTSNSGGSKVTRSTEVTETTPHTLYARWTANQITVNFDSNGGSCPVSSKTVTAGGVYGDLPTPTRAGYSFKGWYTGVFSNTKITESLNVIPDCDTLYAQWIEEKEITVYFHGSIDGSPIPARTYITGHPYGDLPTPTREGYTFDGWYFSNHDRYATRVKESDMVSDFYNNLYPRWSAVKGFDIRDGVLVGYDGPGGDLVVPDGVTKIGSTTFFMTGVTSVTLPNTVTSIDKEAFNLCGDLTSVKIPDSVTSIGEDAFASSGLTSIVIPDSVTSLGPRAFQRCYDLKSIVIGSGVQDPLKDSLIYYCSSLTSLTIKAPVTSIYKNSFDECENLTEIHYSGTIEEFQRALTKGMDGRAVEYTGPNSFFTIAPKTAIRWVPNTTIYCSNGSFSYNSVISQPRVTVTVSFDSTGGSSVSSKTVTTGEQYGSLSTPTREGYIFDGWYTSKTGGSKVTSTTTVNSKSNHTLYAHWTSAESMMTVSPGKVDFGRLKVGYDQPAAKTVTLKNISQGRIDLEKFPIAWNPDLGENFEVSSLSQNKLNPGESATITIRPKAGLAVGDYETTIPIHTGGGRTLLAEIPVTFAVENENPVITVAFDYTGGANPSSVFNKSVTVGQPYGELPIAIPRLADLYVFDGWYTKSNGSGGDKVTSSTIVPNTTHHILYAHWKRLSEQPETPKPTQPVTAAPTNDALTLNGVKQNPTVFKLDGGDNYFKIRDLAAMLNGTEKQFAVGYDGSVQVTTGQPYTAVGGELAGAAEGNFVAEPTNDAIYINGVKADLTAYKIEGNNFFRLRDLGKALDFYVGWTPERGVFIETDKPYSD